MHRFLSFLSFAASVFLIVYSVLMLATTLAARLALRGLDMAAKFLAFALILSVPAYAAAAAAAGPTFLNISPAAWDEINQLLIGLFLALGALVWKYIDAHSPLKNTQAQEIVRDAYRKLLDQAAAFGLTQIQAEEKKVGSIDVGNAAVAAGANFAIAHGPDLAKALGYDVKTDAGRAAIIQSVTARIGTALGDPVTPVGEAAVAPVTLPQPIAVSGSPTPPKPSLVPPPAKN